MVYTSKNNSIIKQIASLKDKKERQKLGLYVVEGLKMISEAIKYGVKIEQLFATENASKIVKDYDINLNIVSEEVFKYISDEQSPQGILGIIRIPQNHIISPSGNSLILDGISDPGNLGTIIRSAIAFSYNEIFLINCVDPYNPKTVRASMSGIYFSKLTKINYEDIDKLFINTKLIVADMSGDKLDDFKINEKFALIIGNEANGVSEILMNKADFIIKIPMNSNIESLNAAVASSILMYNLKKQ